MNGLKLRPYKRCDAKSVVKWLGDEAAFYKWSAGRFGDYPLTAERLNEYYDGLENEPGHWTMTAFDERGAVGHMIMRFTDDEQKTLRFGFIIVDPEIRGKGYGRQMLTLAAKYAFTCIRPERITLGVFENNPAARRCYESLGMRAVGEELYPLMGEEWKCIEMELTQENFEGAMHRGI